MYFLHSPWEYNTGNPFKYIFYVNNIIDNTLSWTMNNAAQYASNFRFHYRVESCFRPLCFNLEMYSNYIHTLTWFSWCLKGFSIDISNVFTCCRYDCVECFVRSQCFIVCTYSLVILYSRIVPLQIWIKATVQPNAPEISPNYSENVLEFYLALNHLTRPGCVTWSNSESRTTICKYLL